MKRTRFRTSTSTWLLGLPNQICPTLRIVSPAIIRPIEPKFSIFGQSSTLLDYFRFLYNKTVSLKKTLICIFYQNEFWQFQGFPDKCQPVRSTWSRLNLWLISGRTWNWKSQNHPIFLILTFIWHVPGHHPVWSTLIDGSSYPIIPVYFSLYPISTSFKLFSLNTDYYNFPFFES